MKRVSWGWQSPVQRMEIHHNEITHEYILMCGSGNIYQFITPTIYKKVLMSQGDAEVLGREYLKTYGPPEWATRLK